MQRTVRSSQEESESLLATSAVVPGLNIYRVFAASCSGPRPRIPCETPFQGLLPQPPKRFPGGIPAPTSAR